MLILNCNAQYLHNWSVFRPLKLNDLYQGNNFNNKTTRLVREPSLNPKLQNRVKYIRQCRH